MVLPGSLENAKGKLAHQRLTVGRTFASDNHIGIIKKVVEANCIKEKVNARAADGIQILQESITQTASCSCTRHILPVVAKTNGRFLCELSGTGIESHDHFRSRPLLWGKYTGSSILAT